MSPTGTPEGGRNVRRTRRLEEAWAAHRSRWALPLVIIAVIMVVVLIDHVSARRISVVEAPAIPAPVPAPGGSATVVLPQPWDGFNPGDVAGATSSTPSLLAPVLPSAFVVDPQGQPQLNSELLTSVELMQSSPQTIQYQLNPAAVWSDGVPVSLADFIYAWQSQRGGGRDVSGVRLSPESTVGYRDIASVTQGSGPDTVTVVFARPFADWRMLFSEMLPAHIAERVGFNTGFSQFSTATVLSAGPYLVQSATGTRAVLVRNPRWWGTPGRLDQVTVDVSTGAGWLATLRHGGLAAVSQEGFTLGDLNAVSSMASASSALNASATAYSLAFDTSQPVTSSLTVRQGLAHLVDRPAALAAVFGTVTPWLGVNGDHLAGRGAPGYVAAPEAAAYDAAHPTTASRLLASAGYARASPTQPYVDAAGRPLSVRLAVEEGTPWIDQVAGAIVAQWRAAGVVVRVVPVAGQAGMAAAAVSHAYDVALVARTATPYPSLTAGWYTLGLGDPGVRGSTDWSRYDDPAVDQLYTQAATVLNPVKSAPIYAQIDSTLWQQMVELPLFDMPILTASDVSLGNVQANAWQAGILWNLADWTRLVPKTTSQGTAG